MIKLVPPWYEEDSIDDVVVLKNSFLNTSNSACARLRLSKVSAEESQGWKTLFPMHAAPANFLVMRIGSQFNVSLK